MGGKTPKRQPPPLAMPTVPVARKWIWWRSEAGARQKALEEFQGLPPVGQAGLTVRVERYLAGESRLKDVDSVGDGILELRARSGNNHFRVLFMLWGPHCVALTAFYKNQQATPKSDLDRAKQRADSWRESFGKEP